MASITPPPGRSGFARPVPNQPRRRGGQHYRSGAQRTREARDAPLAHRPAAGRRLQSRRCAASGRPACGPPGPPRGPPPPAPAAAAPPGAGAAAQPTAPAAPAPRDTMRLAYGSNTGVQAPFVAAVGEGFLARQGIDAQVSYVQGSRVGVAAVMAGELDVLSTAGPAVVAAQLGGADLVWVGD